MNEDLISLYKAVSAKLNIGTQEEFTAKMQTPEDRKSFYDVVAQKGYDLGDYNEYEWKLSGSSVEDKKKQVLSTYEAQIEEALQNDELINRKSDSLKTVYSGKLKGLEQQVLAESEKYVKDTQESLIQQVQAGQLTEEEANKELEVARNAVSQTAENELKSGSEKYSKELNSALNSEPEVVARIQELSNEKYKEAQQTLISLSSYQAKKDLREKKENEDAVARRVSGELGVFAKDMLVAAHSKAKYGVPKSIESIDLMQTSQNIQKHRGILDGLKEVKPDVNVKDPYHFTTGPGGPTIKAAELKKQAQEKLTKSLEGMKEITESIQSLDEKISAKGVKTDLLEVEDFSDFLSTTAGIIGEQAVVMPLALIGGSFVMETAEAYYSQVSSLAKAKGITIQEVIDQGLDNPQAAGAAGLVSGGIELLSTGNIISTLKKAVQGTVKKKLIEFTGTTATEFATEFAQSSVLQLQNNLVSGEEYKFKDALSEGLAGALMGGLLSSSVFISPPQKREVAKATGEQLKQLETELNTPEGDLGIDDTGQESTITGPEEEINSDGQPNTTEPIENSEVGEVAEVSSPDNSTTVDQSITPQENAAGTMEETGNSLVEKEASVPVIDDSPTASDKKERSASKTVREYFTLAEKEKATSKILNKKKPSYRTVSTSEAIDEAKKYVSEKGGFENIQSELTKESSVKELPVKQVLRQMAIDYYGNLIKDAKSNQSVKEDGFNALEEVVLSLRNEMAKEATQAGRANAFTNPLTVLGGELGVEFHNYVVKKRNAKKMAALKGKKKAEFEQVEKTTGDVVNAINEGANDAISKAVVSPSVKKAVKSIVAKQGRSLEAQKTSIAKRKKAAIDKWKSDRKNSLNSAFPGLTSADVEFGIEMASLYIEEGVLNLKELSKRLVKDSNGSFTKEQANQIAAAAKTEVINEIKNNPKPSIKQGVKDLEISIQEVIRSHYTDQRKAGRKLATKLSEDLGLEGKEAKSLAAIIEKEFRTHLEPYKEKALEKSLFPSEKATSKKRKDFFEKMEELISLGALTNERYKDGFSEKFGLEREIPVNSVIAIQDLIHLVNSLPERSSIQTKAKLMLMDEISKYSAKDGWFEALLDLAYANSLSGIMTFYVNAKANFQNFSEIGMEPMAFTDWFKDFTDAKKGDSPVKTFANRNPMTRMLYLITALKKGAKNGFNLFAATMQTGGIDNKYFESLNDPTRFRKSNFEKPSEARNKVFKPVKVKGVNVNPLNFVGKWVRNLVAVDLFFRATATQVEIMRSLHEKHVSSGLTGSGLWKATMDDFYIKNDSKRDKATKQAEEYTREFESTTGKKLTKFEREVVTEESFNKLVGLEEDALESVDELARDYNFTRPRNGSVSQITRTFTKMIHKNKGSRMIGIPFMPFSTILGRIGDRAIDFAPVYGFLRAYGYGFGTALPKRISMFKNKEADLLTAFSPKQFIEDSSQMGESGSKSQRAQLRKASIGMAVSVIASSMLLGTDEDDYMFISGSYASYGDFDKRSNRDKVFPKYTIKIGERRFNYLNSPIALPLLYIGNLNDMMNSEKFDDETMWNQAFISSRYVAESFKDVSVFGSITDIIDATTALTEAAFDSDMSLKSTGKLLGREVTKPVIGFYSNALPQNNNLIKQANKLFFNATSYNQKTIKEYLAYSSGVHMFFDDKLGLVPRYDLFGEPIKTYPGQSMISAEWFRDSKSKDPRWRFLVDNNAIPTRVQDAQPKGTDLLAIKDAPQEYQYEYKRLAGKYFSEELTKEIKRFNKMSSSAKEKNYFEEIVKRGKKTTILKERVQKIYSYAKSKARMKVNKKYGYR